MSPDDIPLPADPVSEPDLGLPAWLMGETVPPLTGGTGVLGNLPFDLVTAPEPPSVAPVEPGVVPDTATLPTSRAAETTDPVTGENPVSANASGRGYTRRVAVIPTVKDGDATYRLPLAKAIKKKCFHCTVRFRLPPGTSTAKATHKATLDHGVVTWTLGEVQLDDPRTLTVRIPALLGVAEPTRGLFDVSAELAPPVAARLDVRAPDVIHLGDEIEFAIAIANAGSAELPPVVLRLVPDSGFPVEAQLEGQPLDGVTQHTLCYRPTSRGPWTGQVQVVSEGTLLATEQVSVVVVPATLAVECLVPASVTVDELVTVRLRVSNSSPDSVPARGVTIAVTIPEEFEFAAAGYGGDFDRTTKTIGWYLGDLDLGETRDVTAEWSVLGLGPVSIIARAEPTNGDIVTASAQTQCELSLRYRGSALERDLATLDGSFAVDLETRSTSPRETLGVRHILFHLDTGIYAIPLAEVREVMRFPTVTEVPFVPNWIVGVSNVRGDIVSIVDLRVLMEQDPSGTSAGQRSVLIVAAPDDSVVGLVVDRVLGIRYLTETEFDATTRDFARDGSAYLSGLTRHAGKLVQYLNLPQVLEAVCPANAV